MRSFCASSFINGKGRWNFTSNALPTAGFALAHAVGSIQLGGTLCTLAFVVGDGERTIFRYEARTIPESLAVMGGGPVGAELAQFFARMGSKVTIVEHGPRLLGRVHEEAGDLLGDVFRTEGIDVRTGVAVAKVEPGVTLTLSDGSTVVLYDGRNDARMPRPTFTSFTLMLFVSLPVLGGTKPRT